MAWDDAIPENQYEEAVDRMASSFREDVERRALSAGVDIDQFDSMQECDLYLQSIGR